ncbi:MAG: ankyrin repeat domain-containing protein [Planctomycetota bacterium]
MDECTGRAQAVHAGVCAAGVMPIRTTFGWGKTFEPVAVLASLERCSWLHFTVMTAFRRTSTIHDAAEDGDVAAVQRFLADGVDPDDRGGYSRRTPLMHASSPDVLRVLLEAGADPNQLDEFDRDVFQLILQGDPFEMERPEGEPLARRSAMADLLVGAGVDLERGRGAEQSRIYSAVYEPYPIAVAYLLERGVRCDERDTYGDTLLHTLCWQGCASVDNEEFDPVSDTIRMLVHAGVPIEARDDSGETPLHEAAYGDIENVPAVRTLIELGAEVDALRKDGSTPLELAASRGAADTVALLLAAGADTVRRRPKGWRFSQRDWHALA